MDKYHKGIALKQSHSCPASNGAFTFGRGNAHSGEKQLTRQVDIYREESTRKLASPGRTARRGPIKPGDPPGDFELPRESRLSSINRPQNRLFVPPLPPPRQLGFEPPDIACDQMSAPEKMAIKSFRGILTAALNEEGRKSLDNRSFETLSADQFV